MFGAWRGLHGDFAGGFEPAFLVHVVVMLITLYLNQRPQRPEPSVLQTCGSLVASSAVELLVSVRTPRYAPPLLYSVIFSRVMLLVVNSVSQMKLTHWFPWSGNFEHQRLHVSLSRVEWI